jgi:hypothetical protein
MTNSRIKKIEDSLGLGKAWDLSEVEYEGKRISRESLDKMKRALAGWAQTQLPHVRSMCGSLVSLSFNSQRVYQLNRNVIVDNLLAQFNRLAV